MMKKFLQTNRRLNHLYKMKLCVNQNSKNEDIKKTYAYQHEELMETNFKNLSNQYQTGDDKIFSSYLIYLNKFDMLVFQKRIQASKYYAVFWSGVMGATFYFIHPIPAIIPGFILLNCIGSFIQGSRYLNKLIKSINLLPDLKNCIIENAKGVKIETKIEQNELVDIIDVIKDVKGAEDVIESYRQRNYVITLNIKESKSQKLNNNLRILISPDQVHIENIDLLRLIIEGENISDWVYKEQQAQQKVEKGIHGDLKLDELEEMLKNEQAVSESEKVKDKT